ncbi:universal stress protein [Smaragdicoccus niigatensis]|uniref:universal stress protein n=1 Tax=Smaragdicoccus niigatensis TaxID=359359 RepID=UPI000375F9E2|nr:universal stress protein [Smaragdicoccus niigatensis]
MTLVDSTSIVVGIDGSITSTRAALWAAETASLMKAPLVLATAAPVPGAYLSDAAVLAYAITPDESSLAAQRLDEATARVLEKFPDLVVHTVSKQGPADLMLVSLSQRARLVVVGAHRTASLESLMIGSTATLVANHAACPVVVWRGAHGFGRVVVGVDGSPLSTSAIAHAFEFASWYQASLEAVHVWDVQAGHNADRGNHEALLSENLAGWSEKYPDVQVHTTAMAGDARDVLSGSAKQARLVVVGSHGRGRAAALILGSTSQHLLRHSPCPVMICRQAAS